MNKGLGSRKQNIEFIQCQKTYTREEFALLRDFLGTSLYGREQEIVRLGGDGQSKAFSADYIIRIIGDSKDKFEVVKKEDFEKNYTVEKSETVETKKPDPIHVTNPLVPPRKVEVVVPTVKKL